MTRNQVKEILNRVLEWPPERQADLARVVETMAGHDASDLSLTDAQAAEVRHRMATPAEDNNIPAEQVFDRLRSRRE